jgi:hypothetical protein
MGNMMMMMMEHAAGCTFTAPHSCGSRSVGLVVQMTCTMFCFRSSGSPCVFCTVQSDLATAVMEYVHFALSAKWHAS